MTNDARLTFFFFSALVLPDFTRLAKAGCFFYHIKYLFFKNPDLSRFILSKCLFVTFNYIKIFVKQQRLC